MNDDGDLLTVVEAAYDVDMPTARWNSVLLNATDAAIGTELGGFACPFKADTQGLISFQNESAATIRLPQETLHTVLDGIRTAPPAWLSYMFAGRGGTVRCTLTSESDPRKDLRYRRRLASDGVGDGVNIIAMDLDNQGWLLSLGVKAGYRLTPAARKDLGRVGTHVLAAMRLRTRIAARVLESAESTPDDERADNNGSESNVEAVLSPDGKVLHAEREAKLATARGALCDAVRRIEAARTSARAEPSRALSLWRGLVAGRWTLVDEFEQNGERYMVARQNQAAALGPRGLTDLERCVTAYVSRGLRTKEIAYTLGIASSTVRVAIMRAVRKCKVRNREELIELVASSWHVDGREPRD